MDEAERCDRVALLEGGRVDRQGTPSSLITTQAVFLEISGPEVRRYRADIRSIPGVRLVFPVGRQIKVWLEPGQAAAAFERHVSALATGLNVRTLRPRLHDAALYDLAAVVDADGDQQRR
jgi:ABC-2 type transport system ATP-binding protein